MAKPFLPSVETLKNVRMGSKLSRAFRYPFEHKNIKKILGSNIALAVIATTAIPSPVQGAVDVNGQNQIVVKAAGSPLTTNISGTVYPVTNVKVTQGYRFYHPGVDLDGETGDLISPIKSGIVEQVVHSKVGYGNHIYVNHGDGVVSLYAHLSQIFVKQGDSVHSGTVLGQMGSTGRSTGSHLHLEIRVNGRAIDPIKVMQ